MSKVIVTLGNSPADCSLEIDGKKVENVTEIAAAVDIEHGPRVTYVTTTVTPLGPAEEINTIDFSPVMEEENA